MDAAELGRSQVTDSCSRHDCELARPDRELEAHATDTDSNAEHCQLAEDPLGLREPHGQTTTAQELATTRANHHRASLEHGHQQRRRHPRPQRWAGPEESTSSYKFDGNHDEPIRPLECRQRGEVSSALAHQGVGMAILTDYFDDRNMM